MSEKARRLIQENKDRYENGEDARELDLSDCSLHDLKKQIPEIIECEWLIEIDLSNNKIRDIKILENLRGLKELSLSDSELSDLKFLENLKSVTRLSLGNNQISNLKPLEKLDGLECLDLSNNNIKNLKSLKKLIKLNWLNLDKNPISDLIPIGELINLKELTLNNTEITDITPIEKLRKLNSLSLANNKISDIKPIGKLKGISLLFLNSNKIADINPLENLEGLANLDLSNNRIGDLNPLQKLKGLERLKIENNQITNLEPLKQLTKLTILDFRHNQITDLSPLVPFLPREDFGFSFSENPITKPPFEIVHQGNESILKYFMELGKGEEKYYEAKMIIIGEGGSGKTTLMRKLLNPLSQLPNERETTKGIEIHQLLYALPDGNKLKVNVWDFGGQEIYQATHQFFLTNRSLYVLLDDTRKDDKNLNDASFNYWLQTAELFGGESPLLIFQNEKGDRSKDIDVKQMQERFPNVKEKFASNLATGSKDFERFFKQSIRDYILMLPHIGESLPTSWVRVRENLEELAKDKPFISLEEFMIICNKEDIRELEKALFLSQYLHDIGIFLHFQKDNVLKHIVILKNEWATDAVYTVLDSELIKDKKGRFSKPEIETVWNETRWKGKTEELLRLMEKFELCYKIPDSNPETWLVPQLFPASKPDIEWNEKENLKLRYEYTFMPRGLLNRLTVRLHRFVKDPTLAWKSGTIFERENSKAMVEEEWGRGNLNIKAVGPYRKELLTIIADEIERITSLFNNLEVNKYVPCNCAGCEISQNPFMFLFQDLKRFQEKGKTTILCNKELIEVNVLSLLEDTFAATTMGLPMKRGETGKEAIKIFISYAKADKEMAKHLDRALSPYRRLGEVEPWWDRQLMGGEEWNEKVESELKKAHIILFLVSADFIDTDYIWNNEIPLAMERHERGNAIVIPVILRTCSWTDLDFAKLNVVPKKGKPVNSYLDKDEAYTEIVERIKIVVDEIRNMRNETFTFKETRFEAVRKLISENKEMYYNGENADFLDLRLRGLSDLENEIPELFDCHWLKSLNLNKNEINNIRPLSKLKSLLKLNLRNNKISNLESIEELSALTYLNLGNNEINNIEPLKQLLKLEELRLNNNRVIDIQWLEKITDLIKLDLGSNQVENLQVLGHFKFLSELNLSNNKIKFITSLSGLINLRILNIAKNQISDLGPLEGIRTLISVNFSRNKIKDLSPLFHHLIKREFVFLGSENPIISPPPEILSRGNQAIIGYFQELEKSQMAELDAYINTDVKLIIAGNSNSGKSTLARYLKTGKRDFKLETTPWMKVIHWIPKIKLNKLKSALNPQGQFQVRIFDFGGQEYFHDTHHIFFTYDTAYVLLWDNEGNKFGEITVSQRKNKNRIETTILQQFPIDYWLESINHHWRSKINYLNLRIVKSKNDEKNEEKIQIISDDPPEDPNLPKLTNKVPILVVQNKIDQEPGIVQLNQGLLKTRFPNIFDFGAISVFNGRRLDFFIEQLKEIFDSMETLGTSLPGHWGIVKNALEKSKTLPLIMEIKRFKELCNKFLLDSAKLSINKFAEVEFDDASILELARYLCDIGLILYFPEVPKLADSVFPNPQILIANTKKILISFEKYQGIIGVETIKKLFAKHEDNENCEPILQLMLHFNILFNHPADEQTYISPLYLPKNPERGMEIFLSAFRTPYIRIRYLDYIHKGVVLDFFQKFGRQALTQKLDEKNLKYYLWKNGIIIKGIEKENEEFVLLLLSQDGKKSKETYIDVFSLQPRIKSTFIEKILEQLDEINKDWSVEKFVTKNGIDFIPLEKIKSTAKEKLVLFSHNGKNYELNDFREHLVDSYLMKKVFVSYSKADVEFLNQLVIHLSLLQRENLISVWHDRKLEPGVEWDAKIKEELSSSDLIIFLLSPEFIATDYIWNIELNLALQQFHKRDACIVPVVVRPCQWKLLPLSKFAMPIKDLVISTSPNQDQAWVDVVDKLKEIINPPKVPNNE